MVFTGTGIGVGAGGGGGAGERRCGTALISPGGKLRGIELTPELLTPGLLRPGLLIGGRLGMSNPTGSSQAGGGSTPGVVGAGGTAGEIGGIGSGGFDSQLPRTAAVRSFARGERGREEGPNLVARSVVRPRVEASAANVIRASILRSGEWLLRLQRRARAPARQLVPSYMRLKAKGLASVRKADRPDFG